ncbi:uncharacterized protein LOC131492546 isoform X1 [Neofelis nebulosa]|uniref:uncharacterized protein LOC131492546 isoform X1 n=1 Tax=Neofelis nebulosa TaxID=61452 RepID=UPI00272B2EA6|nr:uncharacterized protein LOC131492546 isoform X1 [Neofelis nebulosa]
MNSGCRSKLFSDSTVKLALAWDSIIGTAGEVNELSDTDASGTRPEEQRQEQEQGAEAAVGPERAVLRSPPAPDSPRTTAPTSEPAWSRFDLRDPGLLRTDLELVNWVSPRHPLQIRGHAWVQNSPGSHRTSPSMQERKQAFLMIWKPGQFLICTPQSFQLMERPQQRYRNVLLLTHQKDQSCDEGTWVVISVVFLYQLKHAF